MKWVRFFDHYIIDHYGIDHHGFDHALLRGITSIIAFFLPCVLLIPSLSFASSLHGDLSSRNVAKLAIVIDDIGYRKREDDEIYAMPVEISVAIIPSAPNAKQRNYQAKQQGRDILIHLPMQTIRNIQIESGGIYIGMSQEQVDQRVNTAKQIVSDAIGLNNHMGSAATSNQPLMDKLMLSLAREKLSFLDSKTIGNSVAAKTAQRNGIKALSRHFFLDDSNDISEIRRQYYQAIQHARKQGVAILIGHPRKNTIAVLKSEINNLPQDIKLVNIDQLWRDTKVEVKKPNPIARYFYIIPLSMNALREKSLIQ